MWLLELTKKNKCFIRKIYFTGRAFCLCPIGWLLDADWKTCIDVDECNDPSGISVCDYHCENTPGSYKCVTDFEADQPPDTIYDMSACPSGYEYNDVTRDCEGAIARKFNLHIMFIGFFSVPILFPCRPGRMQ